MNVDILDFIPVSFSVPLIYVCCSHLQLQIAIAISLIVGNRTRSHVTFKAEGDMRRDILKY
jgi:hypothetical protein